MNSLQLRPYERHIACLLSSLLLSLGVLVTLERLRQCSDVVDHITIRIVGAVEEKTIELPQGSTIKDALAQCTLKECADCENLDGQHRLINGETVVIPYKDSVTVFIMGAVQEPQLLVLDTHATPKEVAPMIHFQTDANISAFMRRKILRSGTVVEIKRKKERKRKEVTDR